MAQHGLGSGRPPPQRPVGFAERFEPIDPDIAQLALVERQKLPALLGRFADLAQGRDEPEAGPRENDGPGDGALRRHFRQADRHVRNPHIGQAPEGARVSHKVGQT